MLLVTDPADDLQLLSVTELRLAVGLEATDDSQDEQLESLGLRAAATLAAACGVVRANYASSISPAITGPAPLTLKLESLSETFRLSRRQANLFLSRKFVNEVTAVSEDGSSLDTTEWEDSGGGVLIRLTSDNAWNWPCGKIVVAYTAGFEVIPDDLKGFAAGLVSNYFMTDGDDPNEKRISIPGVIERERWVDTAADTIVSDDLMKALTRAGYRDPVMA